MFEKGRCVQMWPLVTAGWPVQHSGLLTSSHIVHSAVVVEILSEFNTFFTQTDQLFSANILRTFAFFNQSKTLLRSETTR